MESSIYESEKYYCTSDNLEETLEKYGVAIIPKLLNDEECIRMINDMWDYLEHITQEWEIPINRNNKETWVYLDNLTQRSLIFQHWNIGHSKMLWNLRQNPKIVNVFSKFWNVQPEDLLASFDGASIELLNNLEENIDNIDNKWFHVDHNYKDSYFKNLQSWVTAFDVEEGDASLVILESSNTHFSNVGKLFNINCERDWHLLSKNELNYYLQLCPEKIICCPKGSLVLWDSRTVHYAIKSTNKKNIRCIAYLCYAPRIYSTYKMIEMKQYALQHLKSTTHDPCMFLFKPSTPYGYENVKDYINQIEPPTLTPLGKRLSGF